MLRKTAETVLRVTFGKQKGDKETWWWNEEVQEGIKEKKEAKKTWDKIRNENTKKVYKEKKIKAKKAVAMAKGPSYDNLYARLKTKENEKELYKLARQRYRAGKDVQHVRVIKDENGNMMVNSEAVFKRWKECSCSTPGCSLSRNIKQLRYLRDVTFTITTNEQRTNVIVCIRDDGN